MGFLPLPASAAWLHREARVGFEVAHFLRTDEGHVLAGCTTALQEGRAWIVEYEIRVDTSWVTRSATVNGRSQAGPWAIQLEHDGRGHWRLDGVPTPNLDGCLDVDLESSAMTNTLPIHRLQLGGGGRAAVPAAYVRAEELAVERLEQEYVRNHSEQPHQLYDYAAPAFNFTSQLVYDEHGLIVQYPGIAVRAYGS